MLIFFIINFTTSEAKNVKFVLWVVRGEVYPLGTGAAALTEL